MTTERPQAVPRDDGGDPAAPSLHVVLTIVVFLAGLLTGALLTGAAVLGVAW